MSMFIGKDSSNNSTLHITKNTHTLLDLKSGILPDTIFHSSMPYFTYTLYPVTRTKYLPNMGNYYLFPINNTQYTNCVAFEVASDCLDAINNSYIRSSEKSFMLIDSNNQISTISPGNYGFVKRYAIDSIGNANSYVSNRPYPNDNYMRMVIWGTSSIDLKYIAIIEKVDSLSTSGEIRINPSTKTFLVGDTDLYNLRFLNISSSPTASSFLQVSDNIALVDTALTTSNIGLNLKSNNNSIIIGDNVVFSENTNLYNVGNITEIVKNIPYGNYNYYNTEIASDVENNAIIYLHFGYVNYQLYTVTTHAGLYNGFVKYTEGVTRLLFRAYPLSVYLVFSNNKIFIRSYYASYSSGNFDVYVKHSVMK